MRVCLCGREGITDDADRAREDLGPQAAQPLSGGQTQSDLHCLGLCLENRPKGAGGAGRLVRK